MKVNSKSGSEEVRIQSSPNLTESESDHVRIRPSPNPTRSESDQVHIEPRQSQRLRPRAMVKVRGNPKSGSEEVRILSSPNLTESESDQVRIRLSPNPTSRKSEVGMIPLEGIKIAKSGIRLSPNGPESDCSELFRIGSPLSRNGIGLSRNRIWKKWSPNPSTPPLKIPYKTCRFFIIFVPKTQNGLQNDQKSIRFSTES